MTTMRRDAFVPPSDTLSVMIRGVIMDLLLAEPFESKEALTTLSAIKAHNQDLSHWETQVSLL